MATFYVNKSGNDADSGATRALAKLTIAAAITAAATGDTIMIGTGRYVEGNLATGTKAISFDADGGFGTVIIDANGASANVFVDSGAAANRYSRLLITGATGDNLYHNNNAIWYLDECLVYDAGAAGVALVVFGNPNLICRNSIFAQNVYGINCGVSASSDMRLYNCTFEGNSTYAIYFPGNPTLTTFAIQSCVFSNSPTLIYAGGMTDAQYAAKFSFGEHNYNDYHLGATGVNMLITSTGSKTTLAGVQTSSGKDTNSIASDPLFVRPSSFLFGLQAASPCIQTGFGDSNIGARPSVYGVTKAVNASMWDNGVYSSTEQSGNTIIPSAGPAEGTFATDVIDHGRSRSMRKVRLGGLYDGTANFDKDKTDVEPNRWTLEVRASDTLFAKADGAPAWSEKEIGTVVSGVTGRYQQVRVTLRTDNVEA